MTGPLEGIRVLDLTRVLSGPWCTMMLSDLGAEVVKIEEPGRGDYSRAYGPPFQDGESVYFMGYNRGKRSVTLNLKHPRAREVLQGLVSKVDILVHNYLPDWVDRAGLDYDTLIKVNPNLVYCWISGYGEDGPYASRGAMDLIAMGLSGAMSVTGQADGPPVKSSISFGDILAGYNAVVGILAALRVRERTGEGQKVSVNLLDSSVAALSTMAYSYMSTGEPPWRMAPDVHPSLSPAGTFRTSDGYINIAAARDKEFSGMCRTLGIERLLEDPDFSTNPDRVQNRKRLREMMEEVLLTKSTSEWVTLFNANGVLADRVNTVAEALAHPQTVHNQMKQTVQHPTAGPVKVMRTPVKLPNTPLSIQGPPPRLGQHTRAVLASYLGLGDREMAELEREGVI